MSVILPSNKAGVYRLQVVAPKSRETFAIEVTIPCPNELVQKPSNLGALLVVNDVQSVGFTNAQKFDREQFERELRTTLSRPLGPADGYSNLYEEIHGLPRDPTLEAASRAAAAQLKRERGF